MRSFFRLSAVALAALTAGGLLAAQSGNDNFKTNGGDVVFGYSSPSVGFSTGANPPDFSGDWYWKVYDAASLTTSSTSSEITGWSISLFDTDWSTAPAFYDTIFAKGIASTVNPGNIEPDFTDPNGVLVSLGVAPFGDPCVINPPLCGGGACAPAGQVVGYAVEVGIGTCTGDGILFTSDDSTHLTESSFLPGGMLSTTGTGMCGNGDYALMDVHSQDETQADVVPGYSPFGGFNVPGTGLVPEPITEVAEQHIETCSTTLNIRLGPPVAVPIPYGTAGQGETGVAGVNADLSGTGGAGLPFGYRLFDDVGLTQAVPFALASSCVLVPPAPPGIPILGGNVLLNLADPVVFIAIRQGPILLDHPPGAPTAFDNGVYESQNPAQIPISAVGKTVWSQAFSLRFDVFFNLTIEGSNRTKTKFF